MNQSGQPLKVRTEENSNREEQSRADATVLCFQESGGGYTQGIKGGRGKEPATKGLCTVVQNADGSHGFRAFVVAMTWSSNHQTIT